MKKTLLTIAIATMASGAFALELSDDINARYWENRQADGSLKSDELLNQRVDIVVSMSDPLTKEEREEIKQWAAKYDDAIVVDALHTTAISFPGFATEENSRQAVMDSASMVDVLSTSVSNGDPRLGDDPAKVAQMNQEALNDIQGASFAGDVKDIRHNHKHGEVSVFYNAQGSGMFNPDNILEDVKRMHASGIRVTNIAYNTDNAFGTGGNSNAKQNNTGLTEKGIELVAAFNQVGIVPDCSHSSNAVCIDIAKYSTKPVIASHSNPDNFVDITRNISDDAIVAIAKTDGVVAINFLGGWHNKDGDASPEALAKSVNYIAELISKETEKNGRLHTGFGSDYIHTYKETLNFVIRNPDKFKPEIGYASISEMAFAIDAWGVAKVLEEKYGWNEQEIRGFLGENLVRVLQANWS